MEKFLRSGELDPIKLGTSQEFIRKVFGEPDAVEVSSSEQRTSRIWKYGSVEFSYPC